MNRKILILGKLRPICFVDPTINVKMVKEVNEDLKKYTYPTIFFDLIPKHEESVATFAFYMEESPMYFNKNYICSNLAEIVLGELKSDEVRKNPYPLSKYRTNPRLIEIDYFGKMWNKNNMILGGNPFMLVNEEFTTHGMYLQVKFFGDEVHGE